MSTCQSSGGAGENGGIRARKPFGVLCIENPPHAGLHRASPWVGGERMKANDRKPEGQCSAAVRELNLIGRHQARSTIGLCQRTFARDAASGVHRRSLIGAMSRYHSKWARPASYARLGVSHDSQGTLKR